MFKLNTLVDVLALISSSKRERAILWQDTAGTWSPISTAQLTARVYSLAEAFRSWGIVKGDRIALLAENRWEWPLVDFATLILGAADVPIYPTLTADQIAELLIDSGARIAVVSTEAQYNKIASIRSRTKLEHVVIMDEVSGIDAVPISSLLQITPTVDLDQWLHSFGVQPEHLATLIYTSGTTGEPKGVMLTHGNIASNLNHSTSTFNWNPDSTCISFLPLSHITARHLDYALFCYGATIAYIGSFDHLPAALTTIQPTVFVAVPRVYEKIKEVAERRASSKPATRKIFAWAVATGHRHRDEILKGKTPSSPLWKLANALVFKKVKQAFGGKVHDFIAGGAPLGIDTAGWFADVGIRIYEGYGLTETSPVLALNNARDHRIGSVGKPIESVECRIAPDGEVLVRGPLRLQGVLAQAAGHRRSHRSRWLVSYWRHWSTRPGRLPLHHRPQEGVAEDFRWQDDCPRAYRKPAQRQRTGGLCGFGRRQAQVRQRPHRPSISRARSSRQTAGNFLRISFRAARQPGRPGRIPGAGKENQ